MIVLKTKSQCLETVAFSPDGTALAAGGKKGCYHWDSWRTATQAVQIASGETVRVEFALGSTHLILNTHRGTVVVRELASKVEYPLTTPGYHQSFAVSHRHGLVVTCSPSEQRVSAWRLKESGEPQHCWDTHLQTWGHASVTGSGDLFVLPGDSIMNGLMFVEALTGALVEIVATHQRGRWFSAPDDSFSVTVGFNTLHIKPANGDPLPPIFDGNKQVTNIAFHPSGKYLAATSNDATVKLYDTTTWQVAKTFTWNIGRMRSIAFSPDGMLAAAGSDTGKVVVWDVDV